MVEAASNPPVRRRWARAWLWLAAVLSVLLLLVAGIIWWAGSEGSLPRALHLAQTFLPDDQQLVVTDAKGSITGGGRIARLQWSKPGTTVTIENLRLDWSLRQLFGRDLQVRELSIGSIRVRKTARPDEPDEPFTMPADVSLPIKVSLPLTIARVQIESVAADGTSSTQEVDDLSLHYRYDGAQHALQLDGLRYGQSHLSGGLQLQVQGQALSSQLVASLRDLVKDTPFAMVARLQVKGTLAGGNAAALDVQVDATQQAHDAAQPAVLKDGAQLQAHAILHPWREQPAQQVELQLSHLNAHAFHDLAPVTAMRGHASLEPVADSKSTVWDALLEFTNDQPGGWDQQRLPLRQLTARARISPQQLDIATARVDLAGRTPAGYLTLMGQIPLKQLALTSLQLDLQQVDLRPLLTNLPHTALSGPIAIKPDRQDSWQALVDIRNAVAGPLDRNLAPLDHVRADLRIAPEQWRVAELAMQIGTGQVQAQGEFAPKTQALNVRGQLQHLPLRQIHRKMANDSTSQLSGKLSVAGSLQQGLAFTADVAGDATGAGAAPTRGEWEIRSIQAQGKWSPTRLSIERMHVDALQAKVDGNDIDVVLPGLDSVKAHLTAAAPGVQLAADAAMLQQSGTGKLSLQLASAEQVMGWLRGLPFMDGRLPDVHASGAASLQADWQGGWKQWMDGIRNPASQPQVHLNAVARSDGLQLDLPATTGQPPMKIDVRKLDLDLHGNLVAATLAIDGDAKANDTHAVLDIRMQANQARGAAGAPRWNIAMEKFTAAATLPEESQPWQLQLSENLQITAQTGAETEVHASAGSMTISAPADGATAGEPLKLAWQPMVWRHSTRGMTLQSKGTATGIQPAWLDVLLAKKKGEGPFAGAGMRTDLVLGGDWDIEMTDSVNIRAHLKRESGDLWLVDPETAAGIRTFDMQVQSVDEKVNVALDWNTERAGVITARVGTQLAQHSDGWSLPDTAPLSGTIQAKLQDLNTWAFLAPPGWRIQGALDANVRLGGTVKAPELDGSIDGKGLNIRSVLDGVDLHNGTLRATLDGSRMQIAELTFEGGTGSHAYVRGFSGNRTSAPSARGRMTASGTIDWSGVATAETTESGISMDVKAQLQRMQVLVRNDRQMTLSGDLAATLKQGALRIRGDLRVDRATVVLPEASAPTLGNDVVVVRNTDLANPGAVEARQARTELQTRKPLDMEVKLDLGHDLALEGQGITTRLEGELTVRSNTIGNDPFSVFGEVRTDEGRYRAWGQSLNVETGVVQFNGSYSNPALNLLAIRPEIDVRAGVQVTGTLNAPRVTLYSDPDLPEGEKLSWVVLGRATVVAGAEGTSMQQAALGLAAGQLSGKLASGLGLDELGLGESGVTVGKRISNELYLTYQAGLSGAASTLFIFYDITRKLTVRAQTGDASAVDLVYTIKFD